MLGVRVLELQKVLTQELKCLCTKTTTVLSESTVPKTVDVSYISVELERNMLYRNVSVCVCVCVYTHTHAHTVDIYSTVSYVH